jgi:hypothetical protein
VTLVELESDGVLEPVVLALGVLEFVVLAVNVTEAVGVADRLAVILEETDTVEVFESLAVAVVVVEILPVFVDRGLDDMIVEGLDCVEAETEELGDSDIVTVAVGVGSAEGERLGVCDRLPVTETDPVSEKVIVGAVEGLGVAVPVNFVDRVYVVVTVLVTPVGNVVGELLPVDCDVNDVVVVVVLVCSGDRDAETEPVEVFEIWVERLTVGDTMVV